MSDVLQKRNVIRYQTFPGQAGGSKSDEKLKRLRLPPLVGQRFLDVGCNEGFFCGFAHFEGAARVVGLDMNDGVLERARDRFPGCEFLNQSWDNLPDEKFDVILLASALHYAKDQARLIADLMGALNPAGTLVLEVGIADGEENAWVRVKRSIDERFFATWPKMREVLSGYAWKNMGPSVRQAGDPVNRVVIHVRHRLPMAFLLMQPPASGKTFISNTLFGKAGLPVVQGDSLLEKAAKGAIAVSPGMKAFLDQAYTTGENVRIVNEIHAADLLKTYFTMVTEAAGPGDFAFDGYVPPRLHEKVKSVFQELGYLPVLLNWEQVGNLPSRPDQAAERAQGYLEFLTTGPSSRGAAADLADVAPPAPKPVPQKSWTKRLSGAARKLLRRRSSAETLRERWRAEGTVGYVDSLKASGRVVIIAGWAINEECRVPPLFIVRFGGIVFEKREVILQDRPDVQRELAIGQARVGYEIEIYVDKVYVPAELDSLVTVTAGANPETQSKPFRMTHRLRG